MGMIGYLRRISEDDLARLEERDPNQIRALLDRDDPRALSLEKDWHALHALLVGAVDDNTSPAGFILEGGRPWPIDAGYGPPHVFDPEATRRIAEALRDIDDDRLWSTYDASRFDEDGIYPGVWDEPEDELREALLDAFHETRDFVATAAASGDSLVVAIV